MSLCLFAALVVVTTAVASAAIWNVFTGLVTFFRLHYWAFAEVTEGVAQDFYNIISGEKNEK